MTASTQASLALVQHTAEALPLPDSRPESPASQIDCKSVDELSPNLKKVSSEMALSDESTLADATETTDSSSNTTIIKSTPNKPMYTESGHDYTIAGDSTRGPMGKETQQTADAKSETGSIRPESTDGKSDIGKADTEPTTTSTSPTSIDRQLCHMSTNVEPSSSLSENSDESTEFIDPGDVQCRFIVAINENMKLVLILGFADMDQFDTKNKGDVVGNYFTTRTRSRALSPVQEDQCVNLQVAANSDLYLKIKGSDDRVYVFEVDSTALASHSPVFYNMAYETHTRGNQESWIWELEGDSILGLTVMLSLLHLELTGTMFNQEPKPDDVYHVLRVFNKYQIPQVAYHPWVKSWTAGFRYGLENTKLSKVECLYVAHQLGDFKSLKACIRHVAHEVEIAVDGSARFANGQHIHEIVPLTAELVIGVLAIRTADLDSLLTPLKEAHDTLMNGTKTQDPQFCKSIDHHIECNQALLGSLIGSLVQQKLYPVPAVGSYHSNVGSLATKISEMDIRGLFLPGLEPHKQRHSLCKLGQDCLARKLLKNEAHLPLPEQLIEHMFEVAKRLGAYEREKAEFQAYEDILKKWKDGDDSHISDRDSGVFDGSLVADASPGRCL